MEKKAYIVSTDTVDPYHNLALEEQLLCRVAPGEIILYLWQNAHTVVIGRNQNPWAECRTSLLQEEGGSLARRLSGGGAVYHDLGNLNFTFICREEDYDLHKQLSVIQEACALAGIRTDFSGRNDLLADGRKFSGNAFYHKKGAAYHHGTLLVETDLTKLGRYLSPPKAKLESKGISSVRSRVINLKELSPTLTCQTMKTYMVQAFSQVYSLTPQPLQLSEADLQAITLLQDKYQSQQWLFGKPMPFSYTLEEHFSWGHLVLQLQVEGGIIQAVNAYTDAMDAELSNDLSEALCGCRFQLPHIIPAISHLSVGQELAEFFTESQI